jgi:hypothetical protein
MDTLLVVNIVAAILGLLLLIVGAIMFLANRPRNFPILLMLVGVVIYAVAEVFLLARALS